jgi:hypothetical protein
LTASHQNYCPSIKTQLITYTAFGTIIIINSIKAEETLEDSDSYKTKQSGNFNKNPINYAIIFFSCHASMENHTFIFFNNIEIIIF